MNSDECSSSKLLLWIAPPYIACAIFAFGVHYAGLLDLPNHMARAYLLLNCSSAQLIPACSTYVINLQPIPYLFSDLLLVLSLKVFPVFTAEKVCVFFALSLLTVGWQLLFYRVVGKYNPAYLAGLLMLFSNFLYNGFFGYVVSLALALIFISIWWRHRESRSSTMLLILPLFLFLIFGTHLAGFLFALMVPLAYEAHAFVFARGKLSQERFSRWMNYLPLLLVWMALYFYQQQVVGGTGGMAVEYKPLFSKLLTSAYPFVNYSPILDTLIVVIISAALLVGSSKHLGELVGNFWFAAALAFYVCFLITPTIGHGVYDFDVRFLGIGCFCLFLAVGSILKGSSKQLTTLISLLLLISVGNAFYQRAQADSLLQDIVPIVLKTPPGSKVISVSEFRNFPDEKSSRVSPFGNLAAYAIPFGAVYFGGMFDCNYNKNNSYFCGPADLARADYFKFNFQAGTTASDEEWKKIATIFDHVVWIGTGSTKKLEDLGYKRVESSKYAALFARQ